MELTDELKAKIDSYSVYTLLQKVRFAPIGDPLMCGEVGDYWMNRLATLRNQDNDAYVKASKDIGWER